MTFFVQPPITVPWVYCIRLRRNAVVATGTLNEFTNVRSAISLVCQDNATLQWNFSQCCFRLSGVMEIASGQMDMNRIT